MPKALLIIFAFFVATPFHTVAQTAPVPLEVRMICYDLLIYPATVEFLGGIEDENRVSSQGQISQPNDEMAFAPAHIPTTHWGTFHYTMGIFDETYPIDFEIDIPENDANGNFIEDLLEFSQAVPPTATFGSYSSSEFDGSVFRAVWSKPADSQRGTCVITFDFLDADFEHTIEILNFSGTWTSAVKENATVHGPVTLTREGTPTSTLAGELNLSLAQPGAVKLTTTSFTDENNLVFEWAPPETMFRDRTEFFEFLTVTDGWLYEQTLDFHDWIIIVDDKNDWDADGTPDLIDPPSLTATPPSMQIIKTENGIRLMITGDVGRAYTLESVTALPAAQWGNATAVTLTANPHTLDLPAPTSPTFWRMRFP